MLISLPLIWPRTTGTARQRGWCKRGASEASSEASSHQCDIVRRAQVSRATFRQTLASERHVLMCPGGQNELLYAGDAHGTPQPVVRLCVRHKGFCRLALDSGAALVPVLCFGELLQFTNAVRWRWMQAKSYRQFGARLLGECLEICSSRLRLSLLVEACALFPTRPL